MKPWIIFALLFVAYAAFRFAAGDTFTGPAAARTVDSYDACHMAQKFVVDALKAPTTAEFPPAREPDCQTSQRERIWVVTSYVDSQNSFGAMIRSHYTVEMIYYPATDTWTRVDLQIASR